MWGCWLERQTAPAWGRQTGQASASMWGRQTGQASASMWDQKWVPLSGCLLASITGGWLAPPSAERTAMTALRKTTGCWYAQRRARVWECLSVSRVAL